MVPEHIDASAACLFVFVFVLETFTPASLSEWQVCVRSHQNCLLVFKVNAVVKGGCKSFALSFLPKVARNRITILSWLFPPALRTVILINVLYVKLHTVHGVIRQAQTHTAVTQKQPTFPHILD